MKPPLQLWYYCKPEVLWLSNFISASSNFTFQNQAPQNLQDNIAGIFFKTELLFLFTLLMFCPFTCFHASRLALLTLLMLINLKLWRRRLLPHILSTRDRREILSSYSSSSLQNSRHFQGATHMTKLRNAVVEKESLTHTLSTDGRRSPGAVTQMEPPEL